MKRRLTGMRLLPPMLMALLTLGGPPALAQDAVKEQTNGVEVIRRGDVVLFRYRDEQGNLIIEDRPPPQFFDVDDVEEPVVQKAKPKFKVFLPPPSDPWMPRWLVLIGWVLIALLLLSVPVIWFAPLLLRRWRETPVDRALRLSDLAYFADVKLSTGAHRFSEVDRIVRTPAGILLLGVEKLQGEIRGSASDDQWVRGTETIANPLARVRHAETMVSKLVADVPVFGRVVDLGKARFPGGMPSTVQKLSVFKGALPAFCAGEMTDREMDGAWRTLMRFPRSNGRVSRSLGVGWIGWLRRRPYQVAAGGVLVVTVILAIVLRIVQQW